ncbi:MAG: sugar isomerase domain-containing protein [Terriglobales bacterium]
MKAGLQYLEALREALAQLEGAALEAAKAAVRAALESGGVLHAFGCGHSALLVQEIFYRAGGLVAVNPILDCRLGFEPGALASSAFERGIEGAGELASRADFRGGDAGLVISNSGRNGLPVEIALRMKAAGVKVIALTNVRQSRKAASRHPSGQRLFEVADIVLDNGVPAGDAALRIAGIAAPMGPFSTVLGAALLHVLLIEVAAEMAAAGQAPAVFPSANVEGVTLEDIRALMAPWANRIRYYRENQT